MISALTVEKEQGQSAYRWYVLGLAALTNAITVAVPSMALPVLFAEISADLHLDLVQVGLVWGITALPGIFTSLLGGMVGDRFGPKRVLVVCCLLAGLSGALRGLSADFISLSAAMLLFGLFAPMITTNSVKTCGMWFSPRQLGLANGVLSMGMALGFLLGSLLSATVLSPALGGWRNVMFLFGGLSILLCIPWLFTRLPAQAVSTAPAQAKPSSIRRTLGLVAKIRNVWLLGLVIFGIGSCVQGALGYLPLYLRGEGWTAASADSALASFHTISLICVIPISLLSDRLGTRKKILMVAALMTIVGIGSLSFAEGLGVWIAIWIAGMVRDGFMAIFMTTIIETKGVGSVFSGTALGFVMIFSGVGNLFAPAMGNSLAAIAPGLPFVFWAGMGVLGFIGLLAVKDYHLAHPQVVN